MIDLGIGFWQTVSFCLSSIIVGFGSFLFYYENFYNKG